MKLPINALLAIARLVVTANLLLNARKHAVPTPNTHAAGQKLHHSVLKNIMVKASKNAKVNATMLNMANVITPKTIVSYVLQEQMQIANIS